MRAQSSRSRPPAGNPGGRNYTGGHARYIARQNDFLRLYVNILPEL
jgi:hypothetical protein